MFEFLGLCLVGQGEIPRMNTRGGDNQIFAWGNTLRLNFLCANFLRLRPLVVGRGSRAFNSAKVPADQGASFLVHNYVKIVHNGVLLYRMFVRRVWERMQNLCTVCTFDIYFHFRLSIILYIAACEVMGNTRESRMEYFCCELDFLKEQGSKKRFFWFIAIKYQSSYNKTIEADDNAFSVKVELWSWLKTMESCVFPNEVGKFHLKETYLTVLKFPRGKLDMFVFLRSHYKNTPKQPQNPGPLHEAKLSISLCCMLYLVSLV